MSHAIYNMYHETRSRRISHGIGVDGMPEDPDMDDVMTWAMDCIEAQRRVIAEDSMALRELRMALIRAGA